jgi:hypothetical protein
VQERQAVEILAMSATLEEERELVESRRRDNEAQLAGYR